ncbi:MAG: hypothetical protein HRT94_09000 [Alphaproteobacteria bacterium]|nr:hypothetical protein [Alphaproteobacteria bacterium]
MRKEKLSPKAEELSLADNQARAHEIVEQMREIFVRKKAEIDERMDGKGNGIVNVAIEECISPTSVVSINNKSDGWPSIYFYVYIPELEREAPNNGYGSTKTYLRVNTIIQYNEDYSNGELAVVVKNSSGSGNDNDDEFNSSLPEESINDTEFIISSPDSVDFFDGLIDTFVEKQVSRLKEAGLKLEFRGAALKALSAQMASTQPKATLTGSQPKAGKT